ncbi:hypothetical protein FACS1894188_00950 [Clostridia bacterium]|nr:hypothetical protein FACS1894188_00950 [Clostridia bacterium]
MKVLFIGGTGNISLYITRLLAENPDYEVYLLNRGSKNKGIPANVRIITADIHDENAARAAVGELEFDAVADFIAFTVPDLERDYRIFKGKTKQFIFISSASAYQKPPVSFPITEDTPLINPYWQYSRDKIACEEYLLKLAREENFPVTIVRPSHTYSDEINVLSLGGWAALSRLQRGKTIIIPGDGTTLWTLTHSRDFAKAFAGLLGNAHTIGHTLHITSDHALTWNQIYELHARELGVPLKAIHVSSEFICRTHFSDMWGDLIGDKSNNGVFDNSKIKKVVPDFNASIRFDQGVKECVARYLSDSELQKPDEEFDKWCDAVIRIYNEAINELRR